MMAAILNSANLNSTILDSAILVFPLKLIHTCQDWFPPFPKKKKLHSLFPLHHLHKILHSFNLINLMMAAILNSAMLNSDTAILDWDPCYLLNLTQTHSFSPNLMMAAILNSAIFNSAILDSAILHKTLTQTISICLKLIPSHKT